MSCHPVSRSFFLSNLQIIQLPSQPKQAFKSKAFIQWNRKHYVIPEHIFMSALSKHEDTVCFSCLISDGILPSVTSEKQTAAITGCCYGHSSHLKPRLIKSICRKMSKELNGISWLANPAAKTVTLSGRDGILQKSFKLLSWCSSGKLRDAATWMRTDTIT